MSAARRGERPFRVAPRVATALGERVDLLDGIVLTDDPVLERAGAELTGEHPGLDLDRVELTGVRLVAVRLAGARLGRARLTDVELVDCDLSGADLESAALTRVELRGCRLSSTLLGRARLHDVGFLDCRVDGMNLRSATGEHVELQRCVAPRLDVSAARVDGVRLEHCDLTEAVLGPSTLLGLRLHGSDLADVRGVQALRGAKVDPDQVLAIGFALCRELAIEVVDDGG